MPFFSIIIPTYNSSKTIENCLNSIVNQTFGDWEIIIQDGCSTDNTIDIVKSFNDSRIVIYIEKDVGIYDAMNKAVEKSKGEWSYFLGSDDLLYSNDIFVTINKKIQSNEKLNFIYGDVLFKNSGIKYIGICDRLKLTTGYNISHQAIFYKTILFRILGGYNLEFRIWADWDFNIRCYSWPFLNRVYIDKIIALYNEEDGASSQNAIDEKFIKLIPLDYKKYSVIEDFKKESKDYKLGNFFLNKLRFLRDRLKKSNKRINI